MMEVTKQQAVVLAGDYNYIRYIETALKSLCYHNCNLKIYIFNQDIPREWFIHYKRLLRSIGSDLVDVKLFDERFNGAWTLDGNLFHINQMTFARYFIPEYVEEEKVLYIDSDLVLTGDLSELFDLDLSQYYLAASRAAFGHGFGFNAGVMLINNKRWRDEQIPEKLIDLTNREYQNVPEGDQSILNMLLGHEYLLVDHTYNFQIGYDRGADQQGHHDLFEISLDPLPLILHYISADKPWNTYSSGRLREVWWHYHLLDWSAIIEQWSHLKREIKVDETKVKALIVTDTQYIEQLEYLASSLPEVEFHIAAYTDMGNGLKRLAVYDNIVLHPKAIGYLLEKFTQEVDMYLDINYGGKFEHILSLAAGANKPIYAFDTTQCANFVDDSNYTVISTQSPQTMITLIKEVISSKVD